MGIFDRLWRRWDARRIPNAPASDADSITFAEIIASEAKASLAPDGSHRGLERREKPRVNARTGTKVLIIDDSATVVALLGRMLRQNGYRIREALSAEIGLDMARQERPDLVFLDIVLPGMDGFAALRTLRREANTKSVPVIMISGNIQATEQFYVQRIGADDFMKKPFTRAEVFARIEHLLDAGLTPQRAPKRSLDADRTDDAAKTGEEPT